MSEIKRDLLKIPPEFVYFANDKQYKADGETFVITEEHTISDIIRYCISCSDIEEVKSIIGVIVDE